MWLRSLFPALLLLALPAACERAPEQPKRVVPAGSLASPTPAPPTSARRAQLAASALVEIRARALSLGAPGETVRHLAFGKDFVLQLGDGEARRFSSHDGKLLGSFPLERPRAALTLGAGSVLVVAGDTAYRFDPGEKRPHTLSRLLLLPGALLAPTRSALDQVWVIAPNRSRAERYELIGDAGVGPAVTRELPGCNGGAAAVLSGGDLACVAQKRLVRVSPGGKTATLALPEEAAPAWRLSAAEHIDRAWLATERGDLLLLQLAPRVRVVRTIRTGATPIDFAATAKRLALVEVVERGNEPRRFRLRILRSDGSEVAQRAIAESVVTAEEDWAAKALRNREVVVSDNPPRIAVGGTATVQLFDSDSGTELFVR